MESIATTKETTTEPSVFRNEYDRALSNLRHTYSFVDDKLKEVLSSHGLTPQQYYIMRILKVCPGLSTLQIKENMPNMSSDTSRIAARMCDKGLLEKRIADSDKRMVAMFITEEGEETFAAIGNEVIDGILSALTPQQAATLNSLLDKIRS